jgi:predicted DsbA family dithiol-disulfide isomerase
MPQGKIFHVGYLPEIKEGFAAAQSIGINGTPSFVLGKVTGEYLDGYRIVGAQPLAAFESVSKEILAGDKK